MRTVSYSLDHETDKERTRAGRHHAAIVCKFRDRTGKHRVFVGSGTRDYIDVYRDGSLTFILCRNTGHGYVGMHVYEGDNCLGDIFLQSTEQVEEHLGRGGIDKSGWWIAKVLTEYVLGCG